MQVNIQGLLVDPSGNTLPNHDIRVTSKDDLLNSIETTDSNGNYSFILSEGWHYVEVLFKGKYLIVGDLLVDGATPTPITLNDLLKYSTPIEPADIYELPVEYQSLQDSLENSAISQYREQRSQLVNPLTHKVSLVKAYESDDGNERSMGEVSELTSCDATVQSQNQVYTDSDGNTYSVTSNKQATKHVVKLDSVLLTDEYDEEHSITLDTYTESSSKLITSTGSVTTVSLSQGGTSKLTVETINDNGVTTNTNTTSTLGTLTENQSVLNSQLNLTKSFDTIYEDVFTYDGSISTNKYSSIIGDKEVSITFTNTGSDTQGAVIVDNFTIGRETNRTLEVDSINNRVTVRGTLRISDLEDEEGNPIGIPEDGNTIFQVFQYGETVTGPWEDTLESYHKWKRENTSVNGYIDPNGWSIPYKFVGDDITGDSGDTIYYEYNYSPDGSTDWTFEMKAGDAFRRERVVTNGIAGNWSDPVRIKGTDGDEIEIRSQYSVDGISNWHDNFVDGDLYERRARFVNGLINSSWSDPFKIVVTEVFKSTVFIRSEGQPSIPEGGSWANPIPTTAGWSDGIPSGELQLWASTRIFTLDGSGKQQDRWTTPNAISDTATIDYEFSSIEENPGDPTNAPSNWHNTAVPSDIWMATRIKTNGIFGSWEIVKIKGEDGDTIYEVYQYSVDGSTNWHDDYTTGDIYRRTATVTNGVRSLWRDLSRITGATPEIITNPDGSYTITNGTDSVTITDGTDAPIPTAVDNGDGTYTITDGAGNSVTVSNGENGYTPIKGIDYFDGRDGSFVSNIYRAYATGIPPLPTGGSFDGNSEVIPANYQDTPYFEEGKITYISTTRYSQQSNGSWVKSGWSTPTEYIIKGDEGPQGVAGKDGEDGTTTYTWIRYADGAGGEGISNDPTGKVYIGLAYNQTSPIEINDPNLYTWSLIKGTDGVKGDPGEDGTTYYTWIAYSDFPDGTNLYQTPNSNTLYIGIAPNRLTPTESNVKGDYTWSRFKGEDGADGQDGANGIPGLNGSGWYSIVNGTGVWPGNNQAVADFINTFGRVPQLDDHLFYVDKDPNPTNTEGRRCITPAGESPVEWNDPRAYFDGDVIVKGTLSADRLVAQSITGNEIDSQTTIKAGSGSTTAGINGYDLATLPDWMGGGSNPYAGYRFWAGATEPEFANFSVDDQGRLKARNGNFSGTVTMVGTSGMKVDSQTPFGPNDLLEWRGDKTGKLLPNGEPDLSKLTKTNAVSYYADDNTAYFGGTIIAGTLTTSKTNPALSSSVEVDSGEFGSNGNQIAVACGFSYNIFNPQVSGTCPTPQPSPPNVTLTLYEVDGANETFLKSESFTGTYSCIQEGPEYIEAFTLNAGFTYFEENGSTQNRQYRLKATRSGSTPDNQRLSIVTQEA